MQLKAERYRSRFRTLLPRLALRWWLDAPDALKTGAIPAAAAKESAEANLPRSPTSARNSAVKTTPTPGRLLTIFASGLVASSSSRRRSSSASLCLVLSISKASSAASTDLASAAGSSRHCALAAATTRSARSRALRTPLAFLCEVQIKLHWRTSLLSPHRSSAPVVSQSPGGLPLLTSHSALRQSITTSSWVSSSQRSLKFSSSSSGLSSPILYAKRPSGGCGERRCSHTLTPLCGCVPIRLRGKAAGLFFTLSENRQRSRCTLT